MKCRVCSNNIIPFMTFGKMPIANGFLDNKDFNDEYFFDLSPAFCSECFTFQIENQPNPEMMFHENYAFFSKTSKHMQDHFCQYANWVKNNYLQNPDPFVVEIGSNDGILLENFLFDGINQLGIEPSSNVAQVAIDNGVETIVEFFSKKVAKDVVGSRGKADAILAANVMCHIPDLNQIGEAAAILLKDDGVLIFEDPYLGDMIQKVSYDQIYDEHVYIFSALSIQNIFLKSNFELIDVLPQKTHGGSMRYVLCQKGKRKISNNVYDLLKKEKSIGLDSISRFEKFKSDCEISKVKLVEKLNNYLKQGKKVIGYGATSKSTTILNYCDIKSDLIKYITDTTPIKQNKFSPGTHIPIKKYEDYFNSEVDIAVLFAWNHRNEIELKEKEFIKNGGKFITHLD